MMRQPATHRSITCWQTEKETYDDSQEGQQGAAKHAPTIPDATGNEVRPSELDNK